ncbi:MaoC family dehydratase [Pseudogemmobacter bohemicus]|uniref:MaoC family dehydratase n=1 Tax=Pseudogemmobacter bohemicus TaxID=2250708 RepID=UPI001E5E7844|nr:MaoC family dehydratase [Pseudogemmobacter bohemicus]
MTRLLAPGRYGLADLHPGDVVETGSRVVTAAMIDAFADLTGDRFAIHMSREAAAEHGFAGRVAHGLLVLSLVDGLKNQAPAQFRAVASLGWDQSFTAPVLAGDRITARIEVVDMRATKDPGRGIVTLDFTVTNQHGTLVQRGRNQVMLLA